MSEVNILVDNYSNITDLTSTIVFFSDIHFDYTDGKYRPSKAAQSESDFIAVLRVEFARNLVLLAGDFYDDFQKSITFIDHLEQANVNGFFVLGNHDYWNKGRYTYEDVINIVSVHTSNNKYFRFLHSGVLFQIGDLTFIGDTGWTSFKRNRTSININKLELEIDLPEKKQIRGFSFKCVMNMHNRWIEYANNQIKTHSRLIVLTHFPMINLTEKDTDLWWSSYTKLSKEKNFWNIFGHTHKDNQHFNHISKQRGYRSSPKIDDDLVMSEQRYFRNHLGRLVELSTSAEIINPGERILQKYYSNELVAADNLVGISKAKKRGYCRCSANSHVLAALVSNRELFLEKIQNKLQGYKEATYINYTTYRGLASEDIASIQDSIAVIRKGNLIDIRRYMTAAVITGYVWNGMAPLIHQMRPLDDYDIVRFYLMLLTIHKYGIAVEQIHSVKRHPINSITVGNVEIFVPLVNGLSLDQEEIQLELGKAMHIDGGVGINQKQNRAKKKQLEQTHPTVTHKSILGSQNTIEIDKNDPASHGYYHLMCNVCGHLHNANVSLDFVDADEREMGSELNYSGTSNIVCGCGNSIDIYVYGSEYPEGAGIEIQDVVVSGGVLPYRFW